MIYTALLQLAEQIYKNMSCGKRIGTGPVMVYQVDRVMRGDGFEFVIYHIGQQTAR